MNIVKSTCLNRWMLGVITLCMALMLAGCGGGSTVAGGVGTGGTGLAEGSITGFGSVIVDGVEYDDTNASVSLTNELGQTALAKAKLGQRARLTLSQPGVVSTVQLLPQLRGPATTSVNADGWFQMMNQWVRIINTTDTLNTNTVLDGLSTVNANDELEVHGTWVLDPTRNASVLVASRIEKLTAAADPVLVSGLVRSRSGNVVVLDDVAGTWVQFYAMPASIVSRSLITSWVPRGGLTQPTWVATRLVDASPTPPGQQQIEVGTQISESDLSQGVVRVQGLSVKLPSALLASVPAAGTPVQITIANTSTGLMATGLKVRQAISDLGNTVTLKGTMIWPASTTQLTVRDTTVNTAAALPNASCSPVKSGDAVYVTITAQRMPGGQALRALNINCSLQVPSDSVRELAGRLTSLDLANQRLTLQTISGPVTLVWVVSTLLPAQLSSLVNQNIAVTYQVVGGVNRLREVQPD